jgi:hypothetical protein
MAGRINESRNSPLIPPNTSLQVSSGVLLGSPCTKLVICFSATGTLTIRTLDGQSQALALMPVGVFTFDIQFDTVTWTGTATAVAYYTQ